MNLLLPLVQMIYMLIKNDKFNYLIYVLTGMGEGWRRQHGGCREA